VETGQVISEDYMPKVCGNFTLFLKEININISRIPILLMVGINFKSETVIYNHVQLRYQLVDIVHPMCIKSVKFPQTFGI
jgi:hypothetical protein